MMTKALADDIGLTIIPDERGEETYVGIAHSERKVVTGSVKTTIRMGSSPWIPITIKIIPEENYLFLLGCDFITGTLKQLGASSYDKGYWMRIRGGPGKPEGEMFCIKYRSREKEERFPEGWLNLSVRKGVPGTHFNTEAANQVNYVN